MNPRFFLLLTIIFSLTAHDLPAVTSTISETEIKNFDQNSPAVRKLLSDSLALSRQKLKYKYGSADPKRGGMDCSGFIHYILMKQGLDKVPRMASDLYLWVEKSGNLHPVTSTDPKSPEMYQLKPGDLLFWTGTYKVKRWPPITHVMIYLGRTKADNNPIMVGSSDGRTYRGKSQYGVSVFDFRFPKPKYDGKAKFVGYGPVPNLEKVYLLNHPEALPAPEKPATVPPAQPLPSPSSSTNPPTIKNPPATTNASSITNSSPKAKTPPVTNSSTMTNFPSPPPRSAPPPPPKEYSSPQMESFITNPPPPTPSPSVDTAPPAQSSPTQ